MMSAMPKNEEVSLASLGIQMPYSMQAEQSVLGAALVDEAVLNRLITDMEPEMFYSDQNRAIYETMRSLYTESWWGEGEMKFYLDGDTDYPTICGTGTEDYIGFAWGMDERCTPQSGCPYCDNEKGRYSIYRFHGKDPIYFQQGLKLTVQQIGCGSRKAVQAAFGDRADVYTAWGETDEADLCYYERSDDYCSTVYWYQTLPTPAFPKLPDRAARMADL